MCGPGNRPVLSQEEPIMKIYIQIILLIVLIISVFGFVAPVLISSKSNELVITGFVLFFVSIPVIFKIGKNIFLYFKERFL